MTPSRRAAPWGGRRASAAPGSTAALQSAAGSGSQASSRSPQRRVDRLDVAVTEQGARCFWCRRPFSVLVPPTTDHVVPRVKGGPSWRENEVAACRRCNGQRGHLGPVEWLEECVRRGWAADADDLARTLALLDRAIAERGGQRRARPYLEAQRRRLARASGERRGARATGGT